MPAICEEVRESLRGIDRSCRLALPIITWVASAESAEGGQSGLKGTMQGPTFAFIVLLSRTGQLESQQAPQQLDSRDEAAGCDV